MVDMQITRMAGFKTARPLDRDQLHLTSRRAAMKLAHETLNAVQRSEPEVMVSGIATLFAAVCRRCRIDPEEAHALGLKMLDAPTDGDKATSANVEVLRDFFGAKVMGEEVTVS